MSRVSTAEELEREHYQENGRTNGLSEGGFALDEHATEQHLASLLKAQLPPLRCIGANWYVYKNGVWQLTPRDSFRPRALAIQHPKPRTNRMAENILNHLESQAQVREEQFGSFYKFHDDESILINCANGVLKVSAKSEQLLPHQEDYYFTAQLAAKYDRESDREASAPVFETVVQEALPDKEDLELFLIYLGYLLYPDCRFEAVLVSYGDTGTGKSTLAEGVRAVLGPQLVRALSLPQICDPKSFHLSELKNAALNLNTELNALPILDANNFKLLASGELIEADRKHRGVLTFTPTCKFWFLSNHLPKFNHGTEAELRRLRFLRFTAKPTNPDPSLKEAIRAERDGIFLWMIEGLRKLIQKKQIPQGAKSLKRLESVSRSRMIQ